MGRPTKSLKLPLSSPWEKWHRQKEGTVEPEIPKLEELFKKNGVRGILDLGCGTGRHTVYFAKKGYDVYGFDQSKEYINKAKRLLQQEKLHANLRVWEMTKPLPYDTANFDAVLAVRVIHHGYTKNIHRILSEVDRVLRKRGLIFLQVPAYEVETFDEGTIWAEPGTLIARSGPEKGVPHHYFTRRELRRLMANYDMLEIHAGSQHYTGYCIIARKRETLAT